MKTVLTLLLVGVAVTLAFLLGRVAPGERVQVVSGGDALSVAFGDAKTVISQTLVHKADSYFHGGVDMECPDREHRHDEDSCKSCARQSNNRTIEQSNNSFCDPWRWINVRVRAPQVHTHLEGEKSVELIPWLWASVKADPRNVDAWTTAWHTANNMMGDRTLAEEILNEGLKRNPDSIELLFYLGRHLYDRGKGDAAAAERVFAQARAAGLKACGGDLSRLAGKDAETLAFVLDYLSAFAEKRGDVATVRTCLAEAERINAVPVIAEAIRKRICIGEKSSREIAN